MATVVSGDYSVASNGDIRYTGTGTNNTVIEFHRWLGDLMDDAQAAGDDLIDITDATASERSTDNIITLNSPYNIDDVVARHLYDGSIIQKNGDEIYDGILSFAPAGTPLQIIQNGKPSFPNFWKAGINADASNGISHRFMLKTRTGGTDIDGRRILAQTREIGKTYSEFKINGTARGNNVIALSYANDLNNQTAFATIEGWTTINNTTEGYVLLDVDNNGSSEPYYSQWNRAAYTINQFFERHKWLTRMSSHDVSSDDQSSEGPTLDVTGASGSGTVVTLTFASQAATPYPSGMKIVVAGVSPAGYNGVWTSTGGSATSVTFAHTEVGAFVSAGTVTGTIYKVGYATGTLTGVGQSFPNGVTPQILTRCDWVLKKIGSPTGNAYAKLYAVTGAIGSEKPTGSALATSAALDVATLTNSFLEYEVAFEGVNLYEMAASTRYVITLEYSGSSDTDYIDVGGYTSNLVSTGNASHYGAATWTADTGTDLWFEVYFSPKIYGLPGEIFRGITHEIPTWGQGATNFNAVEALSWTGGTGQLLAVDDVNDARHMWIQLLTGIPPSAALAITGVTSTATANTNANTIATTAAGGTGSVATITFGAQAQTPYPAGTTFTVSGVTPTAYNGTFVSTGGSTTTVTYASTATGAQTIAGTVAGNVIERPISSPPVGASTGSAIIGSYGLGIELADLGAADKLTGLDNNLRTPPNNVTFTVAGLVSTEDRVLVAPLGYTFAYINEAVSTFQLGETIKFAGDAGRTAYVSGITELGGATGRLQVRMIAGATPTDTTTILGLTSGTTATVSGASVACEDPRQLKLATTLSGAGETAVVCTAAIPTDTPASGTIRILLNTGIFRRVAYTSYTGSTFTIASTSFTGANTATGGAGEAGNSMYISYIDKLADGVPTATTAAFTGVYLADRSLFVRVRDGATTPIKTFETTGTLGGAGGSSTAIRTSDS